MKRLRRVRRELTWRLMLLVRKARSLWACPCGCNLVRRHGADVEYRGLGRLDKWALRSREALGLA